MELYGSLIANDGTGGGGGGTADVPIKSISVNGSGVVPVNKNVNIDVPTKTSDLTNDSNFASTSDIPTKTSQLENDSNFASTSDIPTKTSQLTNDSSFVTDSDLTAKNYADKAYVGEQIAQSEHLKREIVTVLPEPTVADEHTIYMIKDDSVQGSDKYKEYMLIDGVVQCVGDTSVDLTDYAKTADIPTELPANGGNSDTVNNHTVESDVPVDAKFTDTVYDDTEVKSGIEELSSRVDNQFATASGNYITVNDSVDGNIVELGVKGKSEQKKYTGKNLFDCNTMFPFGTNNGITVINNGDGSYTLRGTATSNSQMVKPLTHEQTLEFFKYGAGVYTISTQESPSIRVSVFQCTLIKYNGTDNYYNWNIGINNKYNSYNITQDMLDNESFTIVFQYFISDGLTINQTFFPQVEFGSKATEYEPYVGGTPSPSQLYPQAINSVGDDGSLVIKSENKNILNISDGSKDSNGITTTVLNGKITCSGTSTAKFADVIHNIPILFQSNNVYTFSIGKPIDYDIAIKLHDSNGTALIDKKILRGSTSIAFTAQEDVSRATFYISGFESGTAVSISDLYIQVEKGDVATLPIQHKETVSNIQLSEPLRSIGDVKDEITYQNGKWGILRRIKEINLSDLSWDLVNNDKYQYWRYSVNDGKGASSYNTIANIIAEKYIASSWYSTVPLNSATNAIAYGFNDNNTVVKIVAVHNGSTTESPTGKFLYELSTPTFEPFSDQTLQYLSTYDGITNISNDDELSAEMTVKYPTTDASGVGSRNESSVADICGTISEINGKLGNLTFSASGTTLTITDGTHTWTLEANS